MMQAAAWPTTPFACARSGVSLEHTGSANEQRVLNRQPGGGFDGLGGSPINGGLASRLDCPLEGRLASSARV